MDTLVSKSDIDTTTTRRLNFADFSKWLSIMGRIVSNIVSLKTALCILYFINVTFINYKTFQRVVMMEE